MYNHTKLAWAPFTILFNCSVLLSQTAPTVTTQRIDDGSIGATSTTVATTRCYDEQGVGPVVSNDDTNGGPNAAATGAKSEQFFCGPPGDDFIVDQLLAFSGPNIVDINVAPLNVTPFICSNCTGAGNITIENNSKDRTSDLSVSLTNSLDSQHQVLNVGTAQDDDFVYTMKSTFVITAMAPVPVDIMFPTTPNMNMNPCDFELSAACGASSVRVLYDGAGTFSFQGTTMDENENPKFDNGPNPIDIPPAFGSFVHKFSSFELVDSNEIFNLDLFGNYCVGTTTFFYDHVQTTFSATISCDVIISNEILLGDFNGDGRVNLLDISGLIDLINSGEYDPAGDFNRDCEVDLLDIPLFVDAIT